MKSIILIIISLFLFSCHTPKSVTQHSKLDQQTKTDQSIVRHNYIADTKRDQIDANKSVKDHSEGFAERTTTTKTYDTNKPTDPVTGKPPLLSESVTTEKNTDNRDVQTDIGVTHKKDYTHKDNSQTQVNTNSQVNTSEKIKSTEKNKPPAVKYWLYILVLVISGGIGVVIYKKWTKIKSFLRTFRP